MHEHLFNVENIKLVFILASGLYALTFFNRFRKNKKVEASTKVDQKYVQALLQKIKQDGCDSGQIYQLLKESQVAFTDHENNESNKIFPNKTVTQQNSTINAKQQASSQKYQEEIDQMMCDHLLEQMKNLTPFCQIQSHFSTLKEQNSEDSTLKMMKVKSCKDKVVKLQDAILKVEVFKKQQNCQFFPPYLDDIQMQAEKSELNNSLQIKSFKTNDQILSMLKKIQDESLRKQTESMDIERTIKKNKYLKKKQQANNIKRNPFFRNPQRPRTLSNKRPQKDRKISQQSSIDLQLNNCKCHCKYQSPKKQDSFMTELQEDGKKNKKNCDQRMFQNIPKEGLIRVIKTQYRYEYVLDKKGGRRS